MALLLAATGLLPEVRAQTADTRLGTQSYTLSPGDRVAITVFGQPELSGEFLIDGSGNLLLALVGAVPAADATLTELQRRIVEMLSDGYMQDPKVSIRIAEFRPIYILGDVRSPGSYPYRYGMSVLTAVALAGGISLTEERQEFMRHELAQAEERVSALTAGYHALLARRARLVAQRDGTPEIAFPAALRPTAETPHLREILEGEQEILQMQRKAQQKELELQQQQAPRARSEIQAVAALRRQERLQLELIQAQVADMTKLTTNGLARRASLVELQREEARIHGNIARYAADAARADQTLGEIELKIQDLENGYRRRIMDELQETNVRLMELEANLHGAREARDLRRQRATLAARPSAPQEKQSAVTILHYEKDALNARPATETTLLRPGDIVRIEVVPTRSRSQANLGADAVAGAALAGAGPAILPVR